MTKILLVEDDKSLREIYGVRLLAEGYDIVSAGDGEEALAMAIKERPQLIVSDVMMPKISGFDMLDILRSTTETRDIKVIMMTALSSEDQRARGQALGADRYLVKSQVGIEDVVRTVHEVLGDAPVTAMGGQQFAAAPTPTTATPSAQRPATPTVPERPTLAPVSPTPAQPSSIASPSAPYTAPTRAASPAPSLPQPTAPFSTNRPANLGERVIHPISTVAPSPDLGNRIEQELQSHQSDPSFPSQPAAPAQPAPTPPPPPASYPPQAPNDATPSPAPTTAQAAPLQPDPSIVQPATTNAPTPQPTATPLQTPAPDDNSQALEPTTVQQPPVIPQSSGFGLPDVQFEETPLPPQPKEQ